MDLPFDGAISKFHDKDAPEAIRRIIATAGKDGVTDPRYPYPEELKRKNFDDEMERLQIELVRLQAWVKATGARIAIVFEGRDAAGKGGTIQAMTENLNPRGARVVALAKPTETEAGQWYFQRYVKELPTRGEMVFFDRSWYNRGIVEHVFGWVKPEARATWFAQVNPFEAMLRQEGILLLKLWLNVHQATQLERFLDREQDPLKQWKLSQIDIDGLHKWDDYTAAITQTLSATHTPAAPWTCLRGDDKRRTRLNAIRALLVPIDYARKDAAAVGQIDPRIVGGPEIVTG
jgi:polyphosphate kinase 2